MEVTPSVPVKAQPSIAAFFGQTQATTKALDTQNVSPAADLDDKASVATLGKAASKKSSPKKKAVTAALPLTMAEPPAPAANGLGTYHCHCHCHISCPHATLWPVFARTCAAYSAAAVAG